MTATTVAEFIQEKDLELEQFVLENGFESKEEFYEMVGKVDLSTPEARWKFNVWKFTNGTKEGLEKLLGGKEA